MNAMERADKILNYINGEFGVNPSVTGDQSNLEFIAAAIREAEKESQEAIFRDGEIAGFSQGYAAAREQAAKKVENHWTQFEGDLELVSNIRAMTPDGDGGV